MAARSGSIKSALWAVRFLQFIFAVILTGIFSWFHNRIYRAGYYPYESTDVPLGFSVAAIFIVGLSIFTHLSLGPDSQIVISLLDTALFIGYIASAIVYRHNFNANCGRNALVRVFRSIGKNNCNTVRLGAALLILQILLFFISMILSHRLADRRHTATTVPGVHEEKGRFGFGRRRQAQPAAAV
ncbi:hypothetical protein Dda_2372 [Drechslerella dactyloides]|uniref:MARVEL domain-containing protein n=1 Tax=Drechslerella dactyloides TaxID=74499 RepID=A0AAD6NMY3_DREDA|nr:hypothetical protein Dda_2372 [Drechslerella dactyloides]